MCRCACPQTSPTWVVLDRREGPRAGLECAGAFVSSVVTGVCQEVQNPELLDGEAPVCWMMKLSLKQHPGFWHERLYFPDVSFVRWEGDSGSSVEPVKDTLVPVQRCRKAGWGLWFGQDANNGTTGGFGLQRGRC